MCRSLNGFKHSQTEKKKIHSNGFMVFILAPSWGQNGTMKFICTSWWRGRWRPGDALTTDRTSFHWTGYIFPLIKIVSSVANLTICLYFIQEALLYVWWKTCMCVMELFVLYYLIICLINVSKLGLWTNLLIEMNLFWSNISPHKCWCYSFDRLV